MAVGRIGRIDDDAVTGLALAAKAGDRAAATAFVEATQGDVHRFLVYLAGAGEADDLVQETYLRAMRALPRFAGRSTARTWLLAIARRAAVDLLRSAARRPRAASLDDWQIAADAATLRSGGPRFEEQLALRDLLDRLPAERREVFVATQVLGLSYAEAADVCDCPVGTVRSRVARAREDLVAGLREPSAGRYRGDGAAV